MTEKGPGGESGAKWRVLDPGEGQSERELRDFANDILLGLFRAPKTIPSRYFYDSEGNRLFQQIMELEEYYLTDCELEIFQTHRERLAEHLSGKRFHLVELGAGDGMKTKVLLQHFLARELQFRYVPIDICEPAVVQLVRHCEERLPRMRVEGLVSEYLEGLSWLSRLEGSFKVVLFLGSNIGNFDASQARAFLHSLWNALNEGDLVLIGFDLKKEIDLMVRAYNDSAGVTSAFNLNLLRRINRELGGNFRLDQFEHYGTYNVLSGSMESYLVSRRAQQVKIEAVRQEFSFEPGEPIRTEVSRKFLEREIDDLAAQTGFEVVEQFYDRRRWFADSLWRVRKAKGLPAAAAGSPLSYMESEKGT